MAAELDKDFAKTQKIWIKRAMKGRPLYFGLQAKAAKSGKFLLSKKPGDVKPNKVKELELYSGADADRKNRIPGGAAMGVAIGENGRLTLHFEKGKALPVAEKFVKHFVTREIKFKLVKKVVIAESAELPAVPDTTDADNFQATAESVKDRTTELVKRLQNLGFAPESVGQGLKNAIALSTTDANSADNALDDVEFLLSAYERLTSLEGLLKETASHARVAPEIVESIRTKRLRIARQQLDSGKTEEADDNMDVAEKSIANMRAAGVAPQVAVETADEGLATSEPPVSDSTVQQNSLGLNLTAALNKLSPDIRKALADHPSGREEIQRQLSNFQKHHKSGDFPLAQDVLLQLNALLKSINSETQSPTEQLKRRIADLEPRVLDAQKNRPGKVQWMALFMAAQDAGSGGDVPKAAIILDKLEERLNTPMESATVKTTGAVDYAKLQLRWRDTQKQAVDELADLGTQLLTLPEVQADPRLRQVQTVVAKMPQLIPSFGGKLADHLDAAANGGPAAAQHRSAARTTIGVYRQQLAAVPVLGELEGLAQRALGKSVRITTALSEVLAELDATLAAVV